MAFRKLNHNRRGVQLVSLIDLIFILLIFFVITSILIKLTRGEARLYIPTPKNEPGEAQILIQILDEDKYLWVDHTAIDTLNLYSYALQDPLSPAAKVDLLLDKLVLSKRRLMERIALLKEASNGHRRKAYYVLIRCPDDLPYHYATSIVEEFVDNPNFEYGCVSGTVEDIRNSRNLAIKGNVIEIDF
ncbi:MAG: hypothetical protein D6743_12350 [Calditrichaeota bacterium]|nr:MAG: hypothetical protein D6743_12350 [Calditrichota bacterium]